MTTFEPALTTNQRIVQRVYQAFFTSSRYAANPTEQAVFARGDNYRVPFGGGMLAVTTWGTGGLAVLLMHGWGGARARRTGLVNPLLSAGLRVVAYDQPAHGESDGENYE